MGGALAFSKVQPLALATHALKDILLETLALAKASSLVILASLRLWLVDSMWQLSFSCINPPLSTQGRSLRVEPHNPPWYSTSSLALQFIP